MTVTRARAALLLAWAVLIGTTALPVTTSASSSRDVRTEPRLIARALGTRLPRTTCQVFPSDNVWNTPITTLPVDAHSATWLRSMNASTTLLHPDYGPSGNPRQPYGIPWTVVPARTAFTSIKFLYDSESYRGPYPLTASTPIEGGSDRHALMVDPRKSTRSAACTLFETYATVYRAHGRSSAGSGAVWNLNSNALRPVGFTSADAAGLPILPGLVNYDEVASGSMNHALRFTVQCTQQSFLWPARHEAGQADANCPPMGARFRLNASFTLPAANCASFCQTVLTTMKTYGLIIADNGSNWYFQGTADGRWTATDVDQLKQIPASQFVAVDESCLIVSPNSGEALQPGTPGYVQRCTPAAS
ncbi:MAG TPA: hypothetical protein VMV11_06035 [Acidimicrobiales bacterium]|nr:hypothetical protein [Acidimicrobiales bacterium]